MKIHCNCNPRAFKARNIFRTRDISYCSVCHTYKFTINPCQDNLSDHLAYEFHPIERQDWKPEIFPSLIYYEVERLITKAFEYCGEEMPDYTNLQSYPFTKIQISPSDPTRISGMSWQWFQKKVYSPVVTRISKLDYEYVYILNQYIDTGDLIEFGTYLKPGKLIRALAPDLSESKVTCIASRLADILRGQEVDTSEIQVTDTPSEIYRYNTNFSSCMSGQPESWFQLYDECPTISIAYLMSGSRLIGRALLHSNVDVNRGEYTIKLMDRIYSDDNDIEAMFKAWARENGYHCKLNQDRGSTSMICPKGNLVKNPELSFDYEPDGRYEAVPYMDTFQNYEDGLFNSWGDGTSLTSTDGEDSNHVLSSPRFTCGRCGEAIDEDDHSHSPDGDDYCDDCYSEHVSYCQACDNDVWSENMVSAGDETVCDDCARRHYTQCDDCGEYCHNNCIMRTEDGFDLCPGCEDDHYKCEDCGALLFYEKLYDTNEGDTNLCNDCITGWNKCSECGDYTKNDKLCDDCEEVLCEDN